MSTDTPEEKCYDKFGRVISEEEYRKLVDQYNADYATRHSDKNTPEALAEYHRNTAMMREEIAQVDSAKTQKKWIQTPIGGYQNVHGMPVQMSEYMRLPKLTRSAICKDAILEHKEWTSVDVSIDHKVFWSTSQYSVHAVPMNKITSIFAKEHAPRVIDLTFVLCDGSHIGYYIYNKTAKAIAECFKNYLHRGNPSEKIDPPQ